MRRTLLGRVLVAAACLGACNGLLGIEDPPAVSLSGSAGNAGRRDSPGAGRSHADGGSSGKSGHGGSPDEPGGGRTPSASGSSGTAGTPGRAGTGPAEGGQAGQGGASSGSSPPTLGGECDGSRTYACAENNSQLALVCDHGTWAVRSTCLGGEQCVPSEGACISIDWGCRYRKNVCQGDLEALVCEASLFEPPRLRCPFGCASGRCLSGSGDDLVVHPEIIEWPHEGVRSWPYRIDVCLRGSARDEALFAVIREEIEHSWGRYRDVNFAGWKECSDPLLLSRLELEFAEACSSRLMAPVPLGAPGTKEARRVTFCRTYHTASGDLATLGDDEALLRFVARHAFGHVLAVEDARTGDEPNAMVQGLSASDAGSLGLTGRLLHRYDPFFALGKPRWTLATTSGRCLAPLEGELVTVPCGDPRAGRFDVMAGAAQLLVSGETHCLSRKGSAVGVDLCNDVPTEARFDLTGARWSTPERCVAPHDAEGGSAVSLFDCRDVGDPLQVWRFEMQQDAMSGEVVARIRFEARGACLTRTSDPSFRLDVPTLQPCAESEPRQVFRLLQGGVVSTAENLCLRADLPDGALYLDICALADAFWLSGSLQTTDGHAVTARDGNFVAESVDSPPHDGQIFDFYF